MKKGIKAQRLALWGTLPLFGAGSLAHFAYAWLGKPLWVAWLFPVNESVFEHLKLAALPVFLFALVGYGLLHRRDWLWAQWLAMGVSTAGVLMGHYTFTGIFGKHVAWVDMLIFLFALGLGQWRAAKFLEKEHQTGLWGLASMVFWLLLLAAGTFWPPHIPLFWDATTQSYGT